MYAQQTLDLVRGWLARTTYKPGWRFSADTDGVRVYVHIEADHLDSRGSGEMVTVPSRRALPNTIRAEMHEEAFFQWLIEDCIAYHEWHESREWFRVDGRLKQDPHKRMYVGAEAIRLGDSQLLKHP